MRGMRKVRRMSGRKLRKERFLGIWGCGDLKKIMKIIRPLLKVRFVEIYDSMERFWIIKHIINEENRLPNI